MTTKEYLDFVDGLPKAAHTMEHITNFGKIVSRGFVLLSDTLTRNNQQLTARVAEALASQPIDPEAARAQRAAKRKAEQQALREQLAALEAEDHTDAEGSAA